MVESIVLPKDRSDLFIPGIRNALAETIKRGAIEAEHNKHILDRRAYIADERVQNWLKKELPKIRNEIEQFIVRNRGWRMWFLNPFKTPKHTLRRDPDVNICRIYYSAPVIEYMDTGKCNTFAGEHIVEVINSNAGYVATCHEQTNRDFDTFYFIDVQISWTLWIKFGL